MNTLLVSHHRAFKTGARSWPWALELVRRGHSVTLLCTSERGRWRTIEREVDGIHFVECPDLLFGSMRSGWDPASVWRRMRVLEGMSFDLVHCFETRPATIHPVLRMLRRKRIPLLIDWNDWWGRGGLIEERRPGWYRALFGGVETWYEEHFRPLADRTTVISSALARRAESLGVRPETITVIPGGVDPEVFSPQDRLRHRDRFGIPADRFVAFFAAADAVMDLDMVLGAVKQAAGAAPDLLLVMTGNKPAGFDRRIAGAGVSDRVRHLGFLPYADLPDALSCADVFLLPFSDTVANRGRWPHKIGEYMACGRPTISNPVGDIRTLFERETVGLLAGPDPAAMAVALVRLCTEAGLRESLGDRARKVAQEQFAWSKIVDKVEGIYRKMTVREVGGNSNAD